jgi:hypothetical protein
VSLGFANPGPQIGPMVISEINYHPDVNGDAFVELLNTSSRAVPLFSPAFPMNTLKLSGVDFTFPTNLILAANSSLLVVATNATAFRAKYQVPTNIQVFGPYSGQLQDGGENLELQSPDTPNPDGVPYVTMEAVRYNDKSPWPPGADGGGMSLQRVPATGYGNEPAHWVAAPLTPGQASVYGDFDEDGMPDWWEEEHGTSAVIPDGNADPDGDGLNNWQEYLAGTHPNNAASTLRLEHISTGNGSLTLQFLAVSNRTYSVLYQPSLTDPAWLKWTDVPAHSTNRVARLTNTTWGTTSRFYRLVLPAQ